MPRQPNSSNQTRNLLEAFLSHAGDWRYGYDLSKETGLKSGTLYPILMRLEAQGLLETRWAEPTAPGRPRRHLYRLTVSGIAVARSARRETEARAAASRPRPVLEGAS
ncbi:MAG: PadR family transcriptional regulator [Dehalococcoidia bacterium]|nr:PadR family transcriptional regulator [Dehalococcoidia bacterium]